MIEVHLTASKQLQLAIKLIDPFQRIHWPNWWPDVLKMNTGLMNWAQTQVAESKK